MSCSHQFEAVARIYTITVLGPVRVGQCHPDTDVETKVSAIFNPRVTEMWLRVVQKSGTIEAYQLTCKIL
jgi:hypothetical protein